MRINNIIIIILTTLQPLAASHMVYLKDTATGLDTKQSVTADAQGNAYVAGTIGPGASANTLIGPRGGLSDVKVVKLAPNGTILWTTIIGGTGTDKATAIAVAPTGQIFLAIDSASTDFPSAANNSGRAVVASLSASGASLGFVTRIAGAGAPLKIFLDAQLNTYIGGNTIDATFTQVNVTNPPTLIPLQPYIAKLTGTGSVILARSVSANPAVDFAAGPSVFWLVAGGALFAFDAFGNAGDNGFSTASASRVGIDAAGAAYVADAASIKKVTFDGLISTQVYNRSLPVPITGGIDAVAADSAGQAHIVARTTDNNLVGFNALPVFGGNSDNILIKLNAGGAAFPLSSYIGVPVGSRTPGLFVNSTGIYFPVNGSHAVRVMESAADFRVTGVNRFKNGAVSNITVRVRNNGPDSSTAQFSAHVPGIPQGASNTGGQCSLAGTNTVNCSFTNLVSGAFADVTIGTIPPASGSLEANPFVHGTLPDPDPSNNRISFTFLQ
jgi:hypothetical protein